MSRKPPIVVAVLLGVAVFYSGEVGYPQRFLQHELINGVVEQQQKFIYPQSIDELGGTRLAVDYTQQSTKEVRDNSLSDAISSACQPSFALCTPRRSRHVVLF